jgi:hypothetical protein
MLVFDPKKILQIGFEDSGLTTGLILVAHIANVLVSAALSILWVISIETFPKKYR